MKKWGRGRPNSSMFVLISPTIFEIQGLEISTKKKKKKKKKNNLTKKKKKKQS